MRAAVIPAIIVAILCASPLAAQAPSVATPDAGAVYQALQDLYRAVSARDAASYRALCTRDYVRLEQGELMDLDRAVSLLDSTAPAGFSRTDQLQFRSTHIVGNTASAIYLRATRIQSGGRVENQRWEESAQLIRTGGRWKLSMLHATPLEPDGSIAFLPAWTESLPVQPGASLQNRVNDGKDKQVATFFQVTEVREVGGSTFISGSGYIAFNGGNTVLSTNNNGQRPLIELTIAAPASPQCRELLNEKNLVENAIRIGGEGYFLRLPGLRDRSLAIVRLDTLAQCELVPRR